MLLLAACGGSSEELQALEDDPFARYEPPEGRLVNVREQDRGTTVGKPVYAKYSRMFAVPAGDPEQQLEQALAAARAAGWTVEDDDIFRLGDNLTQSGSKRLAIGPAWISVTVFPKRPPSGEPNGPAMLITIQQR